jgi:integrase
LTKALTAKRVENERADRVRKEIADGLLVGLYLIVQTSGAKSFAVRYRHRGRARKHTLGSYPALDLAAARTSGAQALRAAAMGQDPAADKKTERADEIRGRRDLFENVARDFIERYAKPRSAAKGRPDAWKETARILGLRAETDNPNKLVEAAGDVMPRWRGRKLQEITKRDLNELLDTICDRGASIMANRTLAAIRKLFNWCVARDILRASPCAGIGRPASETSRDRVLTGTELRLIWQAAEIEGYPYGPLVQLLILTGQRLSEVAELRWEELDLEKQVWTLPPERVKNGSRHDVPLSAAAMAVINDLPRIATPGRFIFTSHGDRPVASFSRAKKRLDAAIGAIVGSEVPAHWTFHDLRRSMASGMARLGVPLPVIEKILNHSSGTFRGVVGVYQRHSYAEEKREALEAWGSSCWKNRALAEIPSAESTAAPRPGDRSGDGRAEGQDRQDRGAPKAVSFSKDLLELIDDELTPDARTRAAARALRNGSPDLEFCLALADMLDPDSPGERSDWNLRLVRARRGKPAKVDHEVAEEMRRLVEDDKIGTKEAVYRVQEKYGKKGNSRSKCLKALEFARKVATL